MRIVIFHSKFTDRGGAENLALQQARYLIQSGLDVHIVALDIDFDTWKEDFASIPVHLVPRHHWSDVVRFWDSRSHLDNRVSRVERLLKDLAPDVVLAHNHPSPAMLGHMNIPAKKCWYCHEPPRTLYPKQTLPNLYKAYEDGLLTNHPRLINYIQKKNAKVLKNEKQRIRIQFDQEGIANLDSIASNSSFTSEVAMSIYGRTSTPIPPCVNFQKGITGSKPDTSDGLQILVNSRLEPLKNIDTIIHGFSAAQHLLGKNSCLHIIGDGPERLYLDKLSKEIGIGQQTIFHGFVPKITLDSIRSMCDIFALLPFDEPFGMVFPEAVASNLLVIGPNHGGPDSFIQNSFGWKVPPTDFQSIMHAFIEVAKLTTLDRQKRESEGYQNSKERFTMEAVMPNFQAWLLS